MELAHLPYEKARSSEEYVGLIELERLGKKRWRQQVNKVVQQIKSAVQADYAVLGGCNAILLKKLRPDTRLGDNANPFKGGDGTWKKLDSSSTQELFIH